MTLSRNSPYLDENCDMMISCAKGNLFITAGQDAQTKIWRWGDGVPVKTLADDPLYIKHVTLSPDERLIWTGGSTGAGSVGTKVFEARTGRFKRSAPSDALAQTFSRSGKKFVSISHLDGRSSFLRVMDTSSMKPLAEWARTPGQVGASIFSRDEKTLVLVMGPADIRFWRWRENETVLHLRGHPSEPTFIQFSDDEAYLTTACRNEIRVWDLKKGECVEVHASAGDAASLACAPRSKVLWGSSDGTEVRIIERPSGRTIASAPGAWGHIVRRPGDMIWVGANQEHLGAWRLEYIDPRKRAPRQLA